MEYGKLGKMGRERYLDRLVFADCGYAVRRLLGQGAFSDVYCVEGKADGRLYACKVSGQAEMLEREARLTERLRHPSFPVYGTFWKKAGMGILLREYAEGYSLEELLGRRLFSVEQTIRVGLSLAEGLQYLHELPEKFLFRDVKPANVIIRQDGRAMLIDFGCVCSMSEKVTSRAGSPGFAAPEQLREGSALTASCDVYGLGQTLKAMLGAESRRSRTGRGRWCGGLQKAGRRWKSSEELRQEKRLRQFLEACTEAAEGKRIADMRAVIRELT